MAPLLVSCKRKDTRPNGCLLLWWRRRDLPLRGINFSSLRKRPILLFVFPAGYIPGRDSLLADAACPRHAAPDAAVRFARAPSELVSNPFLHLNDESGGGANGTPARFMVETKGFEPSTSRMRTERSLARAGFQSTGIKGNRLRALYSNGFRAFVARFFLFVMMRAVQPPPLGLGRGSRAEHMGYAPWDVNAAPPRMFASRSTMFASRVKNMPDLLISKSGIYWNCKYKWIEKQPLGAN